MTETGKFFSPRNAIVSGSEGVVTADLIVTVQRPAKGDVSEAVLILANGDKDALIRAAIDDLSGIDLHQVTEALDAVAMRLAHGYGRGATARDGPTCDRGELF